MTHASDKSLGDEMAVATATIAGLGRTLSPAQLPALQDIYARFHASEPYAGVTVTRDTFYGADPRHRLDVFSRDDKPRCAPVLLYVHGGGFVRGDKKIAGLPYFDNIGLWAARQGWLGVTMTYRLAPAHGWPAGREDIAQAVAWLRAHAAEHGGDPARIFLMGHSAGAVHVADYLGAGETQGIAGALLFSGLYDFAALDDPGSLPAYFGPDYAARSPFAALLRSNVPVLVGAAEYDPPYFQRQALILAKALFERDGTLAPFVYADGQNHYTEMMQIGLPPAETLCRQIAHFIERFKADGLAA